MILANVIQRQMQNFKKIDRTFPQYGIKESANFQIMDENLYLSFFVLLKQ